MKLKGHRFICKAIATDWITTEVSVDGKGTFSIVIPMKMRALMEEPRSKVEASMGVSRSEQSRLATRVTVMMQPNCPK